LVGALICLQTPSTFTLRIFNVTGYLIRAIFAPHSAKSIEAEAA
jgi:hypothetical protein